MQVPCGPECQRLTEEPGAPRSRPCPAERDEHHLCTRMLGARIGFLRTPPKQEFFMLSG